MKLKHYQGYGTIDATKVSKQTVTHQGEKMTKLVIKVKGNHEWGLERDDKYDLYDWLVKRFCRNVKSYTQIVDYYYRSDGEDGIDTCTYTFFIKP